MEAEVALGARVSHYDYALPPGRIAQHPSSQRDGSRLLVVPTAGPLLHRAFPQVEDFLEEGDVLVVNESRVVPARLLGRKPTGARAEVLLVRPWVDEAVGAPGEWGDAYVWEALVRPGAKLGPGRRIVVGAGLEVEILETLPSGNRVVRLESDAPVRAALERHGHVPLPPYIDRSDEATDRERYQTVYARNAGSIAAPTAGLHFTTALLDRIAAKGVERVAVTLHVGIGTFRPIEGDDPGAHEMHSEWYSVSPEAADTVRRARATGHRVWAVGTTAVRTLEAAAARTGVLEPGSGETRLFIRPPYRFRVVDALITNFHLPRSTLMMLVAALAGYERTMEAYREAISADYRFYSYGDAMVVLPTR